MAADPAGRVLVADTRGDELLVFGTDPLMLRQRYPVRDAPYGLAGSSRLAWVSQTGNEYSHWLRSGNRNTSREGALSNRAAAELPGLRRGVWHPVRGVGLRSRGAGDRGRGSEPVTAVQRGRMPPGWDADLSDEYEWVPLRLPPDLTRISASTRLSIEAEYRGWELTRVRLYTDGSRRVLLRRKKSAANSLDIADQPAM